MESKLVEIVTELQKGLEGVAPQVVEATLKALWYQGMVNIATGAVLLVTCIIFVVVFTKLLKWEPVAGSYGVASDQEMVKFVGGIVTGIGSVATFIAGLTYLLDPWNWAAITDPKVALAIMVLRKLTNSD